jgi:hypothetical protein
MDRGRFENNSLATITLAGYAFALLAGTFGSLLANNSYGQLLLYQVGDACGITASVIGARYVGLRSQQVAASAFILMGITHGISLAGSGVQALNTEKSITLIMPMIPAMVLMAWCTLFPPWLRIAGLLPALLFVWVYTSVLSGGSFFDWPTTAAYSLWGLVEVCWGVFIFLNNRGKAIARAA